MDVKKCQNQTSFTSKTGFVDLYLYKLGSQVKSITDRAIPLVEKTVAPNDDSVFFSYRYVNEDNQKKLEIMCEKFFVPQFSKAKTFVGRLINDYKAMVGTKSEKHSIKIPINCVATENTIVNCADYSYQTCMKSETARRFVNQA